MTYKHTQKGNACGELQPAVFKVFVKEQTIKNKQAQEEGPDSRARDIAMGLLIQGEYAECIMTEGERDRKKSLNFRER